MMEHVLCTHIRGHLDTHGILTPANHGFRGKHSCETQLLLTTHDILSKRDQGKRVDVVILDFSKAFDTVPHKRLLGKLEQSGIEGETLNWIRSFLTGRKQTVVVDGEHSEEADVLSGVPQGTVLGPLLFLLHINDLPSVIDPQTIIRLFADDCLLYRVIETTEDEQQLQKDLDALEVWANNWGMSFNTKKCYTMPVDRRRSQTSHVYRLNGTALGSVDSEKYLGVLISKDMSWSPHISNVSTKANQKLGFLKRNLKGSPTDLKKLAYIAIVRSSIEYASAIWDPHLAKDKTQLEGVQRKAARWIQGDYQRTSSVTSMLKSLQLDTLEERRRASRLAFMYKILREEVAVSPTDLHIERNPRAVRGLCTQDKLIVPRCHTTQLQKHFVARTVPEWNRLPHSTTSADTLQCFKRRLAGANSHP